jgi:hypothetical protein
MHRGLLIPTERPPTDIDIKRAVLILDQVQISARDDRELIPPDQHAYAEAMLAGAPAMPIFMNQGPVLPLGKVGGYDETYEQALSTCNDAVREGLVVVRSSPVFNQGFALGGSPTPEGWANSPFTLGMFKQLARDPVVLSKLLNGVAGPETFVKHDLEKLIPTSTGRTMTARIGSQEFEVKMEANVAAVDLPGVPPELGPAYSRLAAARLGSVVKTLGICHLGDLHPVSMDVGVHALLAHIQGSAGSKLQTALAAENDPEVLRLALRVERVLFEQNVPDAILGAMSMKDVIKLRTKAWGAAGERRVKFFQTIRDIAQETKGEEDFDRRVKKEMAAYETATRDFFDQLKGIGGRSLMWFTGGEAAAALTSAEHALGLSSWEATLFLAAGVTMKELGTSAVSLWRQLATLRNSVGKTLLRPHVGLK